MHLISYAYNWLFILLYIISSIKALFINGRYTKAITDYEVVLPRKIKTNGAFHSFQLPHSFEEHLRRKKRSLREEDHVHYKVVINGTDHHLQLKPNVGLTSPGVVVENRYGPNISNHRITSPRRHLCHYRGRIKGIKESKVALSLCSGMTGVITTGISRYYIEPLNEADKNGEHLHVVYKSSLSHPQDHTCQTKGDWWNAWAEELYRTMMENKTRRARSEFGDNIPRYIEVCVISDLKFIQHHKTLDIEEYVLTIMNIVSDYYHDSSIGQLIDVVVVRLVYLHKEKEEIDLEISPKASETLESLCKWQVGLNPKDINHPNHHDLAVLLTRHDLCSGTSSCALLGLAYVGTACNPKKSCSINEDSGLALGATVAHEMGHNMGCNHDVVEENGCPGKLPDGSGTVMNPSVGAVTTIWSNCSKTFISNLLRDQLGECLLDEPKDHNYQSLDMPVGAVYDADQQCQFVFGEEYVQCKIGGDKICETLWCKQTGSKKCLSRGQRIQDGTNCGADKWCYDGKCIPIGERPSAVDGDWSAWGSWTGCSRTCGGGVSMRERLCNNPIPQHGGRYCIGIKHEYKICNTEDCDEHQPTFRELQCSEQNSKPFRGKNYTWTPYSAPNSDPNPCALYCVNEKRSLAKLQPRVKDGTRCKPGSKDTCVHGSCMRVGCDWVIESGAVEDICGICNGDATHCKVINETFAEKKGVGYVKVVTIPKGTTNIDIEELAPSENILAIGRNEGNIYFNANNTERPPGEFKIGGVLALYTKPEEDREELHIKGPITEDIVLYYVFFKDENPGILYTFSAPSKKVNFTAQYHWEYVEWGPCSARCGGGSEISKPNCVESTRGKVKDSLCDLSLKPQPKTRTCNLKKCKTRWKTWGWGPCSGCMYKTGERSRQVECVMDLPSHGDGDEIIVSGTECCNPKPPNKELCNSSRPCNGTVKGLKKKGLNKDLDKEFYNFMYDTTGVQNMVKDYEKNTKKHWLKARSNETLVALVEDRIDPTDFVFAMVNQSECGNEILNLTESEFETVGDKVPLFSIGKKMEVSGNEAIDLFRKATATEKSDHRSVKIVSSTTKKGGIKLKSE